jgi:alpha-galactosidase
MKQNEYQAQFAVWALMASQIIISSDLRTLPSDQPDCFKMLLNREILRVHQDPAAHAPKLVFTKNISAIVPHDGHNETRVTITAQAFSRKMHDGSIALGLLNRQDHGSQTISVSWVDLGLHATASCKVRDVIAQKDLADANGSFSANLGSHDASLVRLSCGNEHV